MVSVERMGQYISGVPREKQDGIQQVWTLGTLKFYMTGKIDEFC